jgi:hypothetical protein
LKSLIFICSIIVSTLSFAAGIDVSYGGFSFIGNHSDNKLLYPHSVDLLRELNDKKVPLLEEALLLKVSEVERDDVNFIIGRQKDYRSGNTVTMAFAVDWENVAIEKIGDIYKIVIDLHAQILLFDYGEMKVIGSYPVAIQIRDATDLAPNYDYVHSIIRSLYLDDSYGINIFDEFVKRLVDVPVKLSFGQYLQVGNVVIEDKAIKHMPSRDMENVQAFQTLVAQNFGKYLSLNQNVSLLPYSKGEAIGNKMALLFSNGDVFNLTIPEPDYGIDIAVRGFKKAKVGENHAKVVWAYGSYLRITVVQPDFNKVYLDIPFKNVAIKEIPVSQTIVDDWSAFQESLFAFFYHFTVQVSSPSKKWVMKATKEKDAKDQFTAFNKILKKAR